MEKSCWLLHRWCSINVGMPLSLSSFGEEKSAKIKGVHCMLHRQVLASKTLPNALQKVLDEMIQIVNFI